MLENVRQCIHFDSGMVLLSSVLVTNSTIPEAVIEVRFNEHPDAFTMYVVVWPLLLYCKMLGDISSYKATLQSEGK